VKILLADKQTLQRYLSVFISVLTLKMWPGPIFAVSILGFSGLSLFFKNRIKHWVIKMLPNSFFEFIPFVLSSGVKRISAYMTLSLLQVALVSSLWLTGFLFFGNPNALFVFLLITLSAFTPFWGIWMGGLFYLVFSQNLFHDILLGGIVLALIWLCYFILLEGKKKQISDPLHPLMIAGAICAGYLLLGVTGLLIVIPLISMTVLLTQAVFDGFGLLPAAEGGDGGFLGN
jgi:predicted PurR-regulated permease PerM